MNNQGATIGLVQLEVAPSKSENLKRVMDTLDTRVRGCDLVVFPEYCMGYPRGSLTRDFIEDVAEPLNGDFVKTVLEKTKEGPFAVVLPIFEKSNGTVFNTAAVISQGRVLGGYRKIHLFDALGYRESDVFSPGSETILFKVREFTYGMVTCYDLRFPELMKQQAMAGAQVLLVPAAWYRGPSKEEQWQTLLMARAMENTSYIIGVGNAHEAFIARSMVVDPFGVKVLDLGYGDQVGRCDIERFKVTAAREKLPLLEQTQNIKEVKCRLL